MKISCSEEFEKAGNCTTRLHKTGIADNKDNIIIIIIIIKPYLSAHTQLSPYAQQIQTTIYNEKQYETNKPN